MDVLTPRQRAILEQTMAEGRVEVESLASFFAVSPQTIRKDLTVLSNRRLLHRNHGGATLAFGSENFAYEARSFLAAEAKRAIGAAVAARIPNKASLLMNLGTTTEQVAAALSAHSGLLVISNNINVVNIMRHYQGVRLIVAGGEVRGSDGGIVGVAAVEFIQQFKVDYAVIGTSAIDEEGGVFDYDFKEVAVAQTIIKNARHVILAVDSSKLERRAPVRLASFAQIDTVVTDRPFPERLHKLCATYKTEVVVAPPLEENQNNRRTL